MTRDPAPSKTLYFWTAVELHVYTAKMRGKIFLQNSLKSHIFTSGPLFINSIMLLDLRLGLIYHSSLITIKNRSMLNKATC